MELRDTGRSLAAARAHSEHSHSQCGSEARSFRADAAHSDNQRCRLWQVDDTGVVRRWTPLAIDLLRQIPMQPAREGKNECHDVRADIVLEDLAEICHHHGNPLVSYEGF